MPTLSFDLGEMTVVAGRIGVVLVVIAVSQQLARRALPRLVTMALGPDPGDAAPLSEMELTKRRQTLTQILLRTARAFLMVVGVLMVLSVLHIDIAPALAGAGVAGIAIGFGAQTLVRDLIGRAAAAHQGDVRQGGDRDPIPTPRRDRAARTLGGRGSTVACTGRIV